MVSVLNMIYGIHVRMLVKENDEQNYERPCEKDFDHLMDEFHHQINNLEIVLSTSHFLKKVMKELL